MDQAAQAAYFFIQFLLWKISHTQKEESYLRECIKWNISLWSDVLTAEFTEVIHWRVCLASVRKPGRDWWESRPFWGSLLICPDLLLKPPFDRWGCFPFGQLGLIGKARSSPWDEVWEKSINLKLLQVEGPLTRSLWVNTSKRWFQSAH